MHGARELTFYEMLVKKSLFSFSPECPYFPWPSVAVLISGDGGGGVVRFEFNVMQT